MSGQSSERLGLVPALAILGVGLFAALAIPDQTAGLNVAVTSIALGGVAVWARGMDLDPWGCVVGGLAMALAGMFAVHTSEWVLAIDLVVAGGLGVLALTRTRSWHGVLVEPTMLLKLHRGLVRVWAPVTSRIGEGRGRSLEPALRGVFLTVSLVGVFGALFISADEAFAHIAQDALLPDWDLSLIPARVIVGLLVAALAGAYVALPVAAEGPGGTESAPYREGLGRVEVVMALGALNVLFAAFVAVQVSVLFGGRDHVLETAGLTYAQYARQGFFQLVVVAALTLAVIAAALWLYDRRGTTDRHLLQGLLGGLCLFTLVILASAWMRLALYEEAYGFTRLRLGVHTAILWLGILFVFVIAAGAVWRGGWLPRAVAVTSAVVLLALNALGPDAFIAERNVARFEETARFDTAYASTLGAEAVPALLDLPEPERTCAVTPIAARLERNPSSWISFNLAEDRARELLAGADMPSAVPATCDGTYGD